MNSNSLADIAGGVEGHPTPSPAVKANVLIVDDRPDKLLALEAVLSGLNQNLVTVRSGRDALRELLRMDFAVILLDVCMPDMDGFETASMIRQRPRSEHTPLIFITSISQSENHVARGYSLGAVDYLLTPLDPNALRAKVSVFVELHRQTQLMKQQEERLRHHLNHELELRLAALTEANSELEAFNYSIAHDLRTPLRSMTGFANALLEDEASNLTTLGLEYAARIARSARYMDTLLLDMLAYSRLGRTEMVSSLVSLDEPVKELLSVIEREIHDRGARVEVQWPLDSVCAHLPTLKQVLANLIGNSMKFVDAARPPVIRIWTSSNDGCVRLWVEDNGIGIPPEHHEKIFGLFQRLHDSRTYPGTGIGLALVRKGVERMGGRVGIQSEPGKGSRFWVELPSVVALHEALAG